MVRGRARGPLGLPTRAVNKVNPQDLNLLFSNRFILQRSCRLTAKLSGRYRRLPHMLCFSPRHSLPYHPCIHGLVLQPKTYTGTSLPPRTHPLHESSLQLQGLVLTAGWLEVMETQRVSTSLCKALTLPQPLCAHVLRHSISPISDLYCQGSMPDVSIGSQLSTHQNFLLHIFFLRSSKIFKVTSSYLYTDVV